MVCDLTVDEGLLSWSCVENLRFSNLQPLPSSLSPSSCRGAIKTLPQLAACLPSGQNFGAGKSGRLWFIANHSQKRQERRLVAIQLLGAGIWSWLAAVSTWVMLQVQLVEILFRWVSLHGKGKHFLCVIQCGQITYMLYITLKLRGWRGGMKGGDVNLYELFWCTALRVWLIDAPIVHVQIF